MSPLKIETVTEIPAFNSPGKWAELYEAAEKMQVGEVIRLTVENKKEVISAQASLQGSHGAGVSSKHTLRQRGYRFLTRTRPVNGKDGQWMLFVKRIA